MPDACPRASAQNDFIDHLRDRASVERSARNADDDRLTLPGLAHALAQFYFELTDSDSTFSDDQPYTAASIGLA
jgi:hypothetical protein